LSLFIKNHKNIQLSHKCAQVSANMANPPHSGALNLANIDLFPTFPPPGGDYVDSSITIMINCDIDFVSWLYAAGWICMIWWIHSWMLINIHINYIILNMRSYITSHIYRLFYCMMLLYLNTPVFMSFTYTELIN